LNPFRRLILLAAGLLLLTGCFELEQVLELHQDGSVALHWRLGLVPELAHAPWGKTPEDREDEWAAMVPPEAAAYVKTRVEDSPDRVWLILDADLPSVEAYAVFRDAFIARFEADREPNPLFYPPSIARRGFSWHVSTDIEPRTDADLKVSKDSPARWTLKVRPWTKGGSSDADRVDADGTLVWERPIAGVLRDGVDAHADVAMPGILWGVGGGVVVRAAGAPGIGAVAWRRRAA
jgi:hypothetical protein